MATKIPWTDETWNPAVGCTKVSEGCTNCYAEKMAVRLYCMGVGKEGNAIKKYGSVLCDSKWNGKVFCDESALDKPLHWKKPRRIFVCSMSDLFHPSVPFEFIDKVFDTMLSCRQHTFQLLTKRPERALEYYDGVISDSSIMGEPAMIDHIDAKHIHLGVTAENQKCADERIPILLQIPAAVRFVSCEPLLGWVNLHIAEGAGILGWVIVGCESGPKRRECKLEWVRSIVEQCKAIGVPVFVKQISINGKVSHKMEEWPEDLRVQEYPK